jgi:hypothetical protein
MSDYKQFGEEWKKEISKLPKKEIVNMLADANEYKTMVTSGTIVECELEALGILNDFEEGITTKEEAMKALKNYTFRLHDIFYTKSKQ